MLKAICLLWWVLSVSFVSAQSISSNHRKSKLELSGNWSSEKLDWSIAGNLHGTNPNIYSELKWTDLLSYGVAIGINSNLWKSLYAELGIASQNIYSGSVTDTDYQEDNRQNVSFFATLRSDKGSTKSLRALFGYGIIKNNLCLIVPYIGYGYNVQSLHLLDNGSSESAGLDATYRTNWKGFAVKLQTVFYLNSKTQLCGSLSYLQSNYKARANWNLIEDFQHPVSFEHIAKGFRLTSEIQTDRKLTSSLSAFANVNWNYASTGAGIDYLYRQSGEVAQTRLNDVTGDGYGFKIGVSYLF